MHRLVELRNISDFKRPFELIEHILITQGGRSALLGKLGLEAAEGIDALVSQSLAYERGSVPNLTGFLVWLNADDLEIKRQMDSVGDKIRVMTVHGAKGLEAPIVILPDTTARKPPKTPDVVDHHGLAVWKPNSKLIPNILTPTLDALKSRQLEERDRLLYVALTRAESWVIVMGSGEIKEGQDCWHNIINTAVLAKKSTPLITPAGIGLRYEPLLWEAGELKLTETIETFEYKVPSWVKTKTDIPVLLPGPQSPSELGGEKFVASGSTPPNPNALRLGSAVHHLLEILPNLPYKKWERVANLLIDKDILSLALVEATKILKNPSLAFIFATDTLAEVDVSAHLDELGGDPIQGSIDRLIISNHKIMAVDFKTNQVVPKIAEQVPEGILRQMGAYASALSQIFPNHEIETAVLWTKSQHLMQLPHQLVISSLESTSRA